MRVPPTARREPTQDQNRQLKVPFVVENKTYFLIHAPYTNMYYFDISVTYHQGSHHVNFIIIPPRFI